MNFKLLCLLILYRITDYKNLSLEEGLKYTWSTRVSLPSSESGLPIPVPASECASRLGPKGGQHSLVSEGGGDPIRTTGQKAWHSVYSVLSLQFILGWF